MNWYKHQELVMALFSGLLILVAYVLEKNDGASALYISLYLIAYVIGGYAKAKEGIEDTLETKTLNVELLMIFAALCAAGIGYWHEGAILIFIFAMSGALETYTLQKNERALHSLMALQPEEAWLVVGDETTKVLASTLQVGDLILVKPGERVPSDAIIVHGETTLDQAAITGESMPVTRQENEAVYAGTVNLTGAITARVNKAQQDTLVFKIIELVQNAQSEKSPAQQLIERYESGYVYTVLIGALLYAVVPPLFFAVDWTESIYRAAILLVVASPCALVAAIMPATLAAIANGAKRGILFKGGVHLENLANVNAIAFDKTGTLTRGEPKVVDVWTDTTQLTSKDWDIIASMERKSNHPLAHAIVSWKELQIGDGVFAIQTLKDVPGYGIESSVDNAYYQIGKRDFVLPALMDAQIPDEVNEWQKRGSTLVWVCRDGELIAVLAIEDTVRDESAQAIRALNNERIETIMLTGDTAQTAARIAEATGVKHVHAELLPAEKVTHVKEIKDAYGSVAMVGDGINDAPALANATVGIAMGEGSDVALETADVVLMKNELARIPEAIHLAKRMKRIVRQNIAISVGMITLLIISNLFGNLDMPLGVIGHEGSTILVILNGLRLLRP
ncbi:MAG: heavy metal translocating P-type ATPase [Bacilli bacterium]